jgi:hypothetical protein
MHFSLQQGRGVRNKSGWLSLLSYLISFQRFVSIELKPETFVLHNHSKVWSCCLNPVPGWSKQTCTF